MLLSEREMDPRRRPGASILDALGLVKKQTAKRSAGKLKYTPEICEVVDFTVFCF